jgi:hypothetical protein
MAKLLPTTSSRSGTFCDHSKALLIPHHLPACWAERSSDQVALADHAASRNAVTWNDANHVHIT